MIYEAILATVLFRDKLRGWPAMKKVIILYLKACSNNMLQVQYGIHTDA